ncbi:hypothetical protein CXB51_034512 [Gossypium anomalum]|uniref:RNase H type-1 domain-containing protein n=1 Tax=Gossypium anomalum TaxID=47600 RepID=A0A8J5Y141_9ROSI|nr:hypothetical protein CXB51_034512 [Gossypium anomalum]
MVESREHIFKDCAVKKDIWQWINCAWSIDLKRTRFIEWITWIFANNPTRQCRLIACAIWELWTDRNKWVHERKIKSGVALARFVKDYITELDGLENALPRPTLRQNSWKLLVDPLVRINVDVTYGKLKNKSCLGIVIRDFRGSVVGSRTVLNENVPSLFAVEALVCTQGMQLGLDMGATDLEIEIDALKIIRKLWMKIEDKS